MSTSPPLVVADRYRLVAPLGQGGMGRVWRATDVVLHREVAIKELVPPPGLTPEERQEMRERSLREARAIARLNNINVVRVFDVLRTDADPWIVMEYVPSRSLQDRLATDGPFPPVRAAEIGLGVLNALRAAHRNGVVHRDVKPGNVLIGEDGRVVLTDFGLATVPGDPNVTRTGLVLGSPAYIAPERARDGTAGPAADLWSLGATLYAAVEGASPFARSSAIATLAALATENPPPARNAGPLKPVLNGLLRKDPTHRINADEAERLLLRAAGRKSKLAFPMSPTMRRPGVGRERPAYQSGPPIIPGQPAAAGSAPVVPGPRPPVTPGRTSSESRPPVTPGRTSGEGRPPVFTPGKASVGPAYGAITPGTAAQPNAMTDRTVEERQAADRQEVERAAQQAAAERGAAREAAERAAREATEREAAAREADRAAKEREAAERAARERDAAERWTAAEREVTTQRAEVERADAERQAVEGAGAEHAEAEHTQAERAEAERQTAERAQAERQTAERAEAERQTAERAQAERQTADRAEAERQTAERAEAERQNADRAEAERQNAERAEAEQQTAERAEAERQTAEGAEAERPAAERAEAERAEREAAERATVADQQVAERDAESRTAADEQAPDQAAEESSVDSDTGAPQGGAGNRPVVGARAGAHTTSKAARKKGRGRTGTAASQPRGAVAAEPSTATGDTATTGSPQDGNPVPAGTDATAVEPVAAPAVAATAAAGAQVVDGAEQAAPDEPDATEAESDTGAEAPAQAETDAARPETDEDGTVVPMRTEVDRNADAPRGGKSKPKVAAARSGERRVTTATLNASDAVSVPLPGAAVPERGATGARPHEDPANAGVPAFAGSSRPAWQPMPVKPPTLDRGLTVLGTTLTRRQTAIGGAILIALLLLLALLVPKAVGDEKQNGRTAGGVPPASAAATPTTTPATTQATTRATPSQQSTTTHPPSTAATTNGTVALPAGWHLYRDSTGFSVPVPNGWNPVRRGSEVYFTEPGGQYRLLIVDQTNRPKPDPVKDWQTKEAARISGYRNYHRISIHAVSYWDKAADWEFTRTSESGNPVHTVKRGFITAKDQAYGITWSTSAGDWNANKANLQLIYKGFIPAKS